jgi:L-rhamnose-H+ transport protein
MHHYLLWGVTIILIAGLISGSFVVPTMRVSEWQWEHIWSVYAVSGFIFCPVVLALISSPGMLSTVLRDQGHLVTRVGAYGILFGVGFVLYGVCWRLMGIAASTALITGVAVLVGSIGPLVVGAAQIDRRGWIRLGVGLVPLLAGLVFSTIATIRRDEARQVARAEKISKSGSIVGVVLAFLSGSLSAMLNVGFSVGYPLQQIAQGHSYSPYSATLVIWVPLLAGGFLANFGYPAFLVHRRGTWSTFFKLEGSVGLWFRAFLMGFLWFGAIFLYGYGACLMGPGGTVYGWGLIAGGGLLGSYILGVFAGEWRGAGLRPKVLMAISVLFFLLSLGILSIP